jgi:methionyl-tRNA formyltransferase
MFPESIIKRHQNSQEVVLTQRFNENRCMRVVFIGQNSTYSCPALSVMSASDSQWDLVGVIEGLRRPRGFRRHRLYRPGFRAKPSEGSLLELASHLGVAALSTCDINASESLAYIRSLGADLLVCAGFDRLFSQQLLESAKKGAINAHPSLLPKHRGPAPLFWAARAGQSVLGVTVHQIDSKEDHGPIYLQESVDLEPMATGEIIYAAAGRLAGRLLQDVLGHIAHGSAQSTAQDHARATRAPRPKPEDAQFESHEWTCTALLNFVNIAPFYRSAWCRCGDDIFFIRQGLGWQPDRKLPAHYILQTDRLLLQCRDGIVELTIQI